MYVLITTFFVLLCCSSLFTNSNWFAFQDDRVGDEPTNTSSSEMMDRITLNGASNGGNSSSDDEVVVGEDEELVESNNPANGISNSNTNDSTNGNTKNEASASGDMGFFKFETSDNEDLFGDRPIPEWVGWGESSSVNPFEDNTNNSSENLSNPVEAPMPLANSSSSGGETVPNGALTPVGSSEGSSAGSDSSQKSGTAPSLFEEDVEFVGVEPEGTEKAMEQALKEGIVGEAGPLKRNVVPKKEENLDDGGAGIKEFNDANYWRVDQEVAVLE